MFVKGNPGTDMGPWNYAFPLFLRSRISRQTDWRAFGGHRISYIEDGKDVHREKD